MSPKSVKGGQRVKLHRKCKGATTNRVASLKSVVDGERIKLTRKRKALNPLNGNIFSPIISGFDAFRSVGPIGTYAFGHSSPSTALQYGSAISRNRTTLLTDLPEIRPSQQGPGPIAAQLGIPAQCKKILI
eukprot:31131_1